MTNSKLTKKALLTSVMALFLCVAMLTGTTFAWFTDTVTSSGNIIKAGTLEVTMEWKDASANGAQQSYKDASEGAIFNYNKWEPGYVEAKNIKIGNAGDLALKYQLNIVATGEVSKLAEVIEVYYAEGEFTLANRSMTDLAYIGTLDAVLASMSSTANGDLLVGESDTVTIALKMQEEAGNNYQKLSIGSEFAVQLLATQLTYEGDSIDNQYDKDSEYPWDGKIPDITFDDLNADVVFETDTRYVDATKSSVTVSNAGELLWVMMQDSAAIDNYFANKYPGFITARWGSWTIKLDADIDFGGLPIAPMELRAKVFDGQGYTIKNVIVDGNGGQAGLFRWNSGTISTLTVENITVVNGGGYGTGAVAGGGGNYVNVTAKNISVSGEYAVGGISGYYGYTYTNCSVIGEANTITSTASDCPDGVGGIAGFLNTDTTETILFTNCKVENTTISATDEVGGIVGRAVALGTTDSITLNGCTTSGVTLNTTDASATYKGDLIGRNYDSGNVFVNN